MRVPTTNQVLPGAFVNIVLKADQPTGRTVSGRIQDVLTRGNHPRGIKVRLSDGRVGRVQSMVSSSSSTTTTTIDVNEAVRRRGWILRVLMLRLRCILGEASQVEEEEEVAVGGEREEVVGIDMNEMTTPTKLEMEFHLTNRLSVWKHISGRRGINGAREEQTEAKVVIAHDP